MLPVLHLRGGWEQPEGEYHRLGAGAVPAAVWRGREQVGHLPLRLRPAAPSNLSGALRGESEARPAAHPARAGREGFSRQVALQILRVARPIGWMVQQGVDVVEDVPLAHARAILLLELPQRPIGDILPPAAPILRVGVEREALEPIG